MTRRKKRADIFSPQKRSEIMRAVKGKDTGPEIALRRALHKMGFRYRLNVKTLPGAPDLVFPKYRAIVFVHGCFWHGHHCPRGRRTPKTNAEYWRAKIARNVERDRKTIAALRRHGWFVKISWECDLKNSPGEANKIAGWLMSRRAQGRMRCPRNHSLQPRTMRSRSITLKKTIAAGTR